MTRLAIALTLIGALLVAPASLRASGEIADLAEEICPLNLGSDVPDVMVSDAWGKPLRLRRAVAGRYSVLIFYRGGWCPYCSEHLGQLRKVEKDLTQLGFQVLAISPDSVEQTVETARKVGGSPRYRLLSDPDLEAARAFGIAFRLSSGTLSQLRKFGISLLDASGGANEDVLPVPAVFVLDRDGKVAFAHSNPDYKSRLSPEVLLAVARTLREAGEGKGEK